MAKPFSSTSFCIFSYWSITLHFSEFGTIMLWTRIGTLIYPPLTVNCKNIPLATCPAKYTILTIHNPHVRKTFSFFSYAFLNLVLFIRTFFPSSWFLNLLNPNPFLALLILSLYHSLRFAHALLHCSVVTYSLYLWLYTIFKFILYLF